MGETTPITDNSVESQTATSDSAKCLFVPSADYVICAYNKDGLCGLICTDDAYPRNSAFACLRKVSHTQAVCAQGNHAIPEMVLLAGKPFQLPVSCRRAGLLRLSACLICSCAGSRCLLLVDDRPWRITMQSLWEPGSKQRLTIRRQCHAWMPA